MLISTTMISALTENVLINNILYLNFQEELLLKKTKKQILENFVMAHHSYSYSNYGSISQNLTSLIVLQL